MESAFLATVASSMGDPGGPVLIGLSGGTDSVVLLHALRRLGFAVRAAHLDHAMRDDSAADAAWVAERCAAWGVPLVCERLEVPPVGEEAARDARLAYMERVAEEGEAIALGHHADDQAETLLFRLARGTGPDGMGGIPPERRLGRHRLIRPLLAVDRPTLEAIRDLWRLPALDDPSNADPAYARNRLRHEAIPALRAVNPAAISHIAAYAALSREESAARQERIARLAKFTLQAIAPGVVEVDRRALVALPPTDAHGLLREAWRRTYAFVPEAVAIAGGLDVAHGGAACDLGHGVRALATGDALVLVRREVGPSARPFVPDGPQDTTPWGWEVNAGTPDWSLQADATRVRLAHPPDDLVWRQAEPEEDVITPWGEDRPRKLRTFLTRQGIPAHRQESLLVLASGRSLAWVVGIRRGSLAPAEPGSSDAVEMQAAKGFPV